MNKCDPFFMKVWRGVTFFNVLLFGAESWQWAGWCGCWGRLGWRGCHDVYDKGSHFLVSHFLEWGVGLMGVGVVGGLMGFGVVCLWIYCLEVFAIGVTLFWSHFFVQIFYEYIVWKGFAVGGSHFLMSHYIEFMSFIELANLLNSWTYGPINNNNNTNFLLTGFTNVSR